MKSRVFLSHDHRDSATARVLANTLSRITLRQIDAWFSSDTEACGGLQPGQVWLDEIRERLLASRAIIVLVTPNSIERPWILFESGFGAALDNCDVIPVVLGVDISRDLPFLLAMYQAYKVTDYESLKKLMGRYY